LRQYRPVNGVHPLRAVVFHPDPMAALEAAAERKRACVAGVNLRQALCSAAAGHSSWKTAVSDILRERAAGKTGPLVLMGHSQGANNVIDMARALSAHNVRVDLLVTLVPLMQNPVPFCTSASTRAPGSIRIFRARYWPCPGRRRRRKTKPAPATRPRERSRVRQKGSCRSARHRRGNARPSRPVPG
jgi:alpha-beta hydrolase superfamily lysophospholipase